MPSSPSHLINPANPDVSTAPVDPRSKSFYRPDIDGLRALAVLPVLLFHADLQFRGGFVGVDVFFVISGYLITQIIERDLKARRFSVLAFYQRRVRRIFPALFVMFAVSTLVAYAVLVPSELKDFGKTLLASSAFSSNILFNRWSGYFAPNSEHAPLLHTWTLSVEEQFYVGWPLLLAAFSLPAASKWKIPATLSILLGSLMLSAYWVTTEPNAAFYLLPSRAWELGLGALLALSPVSAILRRLPRTVASIASLTGISLLATAVMTFDKVTPFPGFAALLPCMGAALIIAAGEGGTSIGGRILSLRPLVGIGLISYSLYLWHWPILVFGHLLANRPLQAVERGGLLGLTFVAAWLSWRFVESPFRHAQVARAGNGTWVLGGLATSAVFVAVGALLFVREGLPARGRDVVGFLKDLAAEENAFQTSRCLVARTASLPDVNGCLLGAPSPASRYEMVLWGDSHAAQLASALGEIGQRHGVTTRQVTKAGCPPIPGGVRVLPADWMKVGCPAFNDDVLEAVLADQHVRVIVLAARWDVVASGRNLLALGNATPSLSDSHQLFVSSLRKALTALADSGRQVILVGQVPLPPTEFISCITRARFKGWDENGCALEESRARADTEHAVNQLLLEAVSHLESNVQIVRPYEYLCNDEGCMVEAGEQFLYMDDSHLSRGGVRLFQSSLERSIASALTRSTRETVPLRLVPESASEQMHRRKE